MHEAVTLLRFPHYLFSAARIQVPELLTILTAYANGVRIVRVILFMVEDQCLKHPTLANDFLSIRAVGVLVRNSTIFV